LCFSLSMTRLSCKGSGIKDCALPSSPYELRRDEKTPPVSLFPLSFFSRRQRNLCGAPPFGSGPTTQPPSLSQAAPAGFDSFHFRSLEPEIPLPRSGLCGCAKIRIRMKVMFLPPSPANSAESSVSSSASDTITCFVSCLTLAAMQSKDVFRHASPLFLFFFFPPRPLPKTRSCFPPRRLNRDGV